MSIMQVPLIFASVRVADLRFWGSLVLWSSGCCRFPEPAARCDKDVIKSLGSKTPSASTAWYVTCLFQSTGSTPSSIVSSTDQGRSAKSPILALRSTNIMGSRTVASLVPTVNRQ